MNFHNQHRFSVVTLSEAKGLSRWAERCFPFAEFTLERSEGLRASAHSLNMTVPTLNIKIHHRAATPSFRSIRLTLLGDRKPRPYVTTHFSSTEHQSPHKK